MSPGRVGLAIGGLSDAPYVRILAAARLAEDLGYEAIFVSETWGRDALTTLAALARDTSRVQLGTGIVNVFSRSAGTLAMAAASIQELSGGRLILGVGTSGRRLIEDWHGGRYVHATEQLSLTLKDVRDRLVGGDRGPFRLKIPAKVPLWVAALSPASIRAAIPLADGWLGHFFSPERSVEDVAILHDAVRASSRDRSEVTLAAYVYAVAGAGDGARQPLRRHLAFYLGSMGTAYRAQVARHGHGAEGDKIARLAAARRHSEAREAVSDELIDEYTLWGDAARFADRLDAHRRAGLDLPIVALPNGLDDDQVARTIRAGAPSA